MYENENNVYDMGLAGIDSYETTGAPVSWNDEVEPLFGQGDFIEELGYIGDASNVEIIMEDDDFDGDEYITPMLEFAPMDYQMIKNNGGIPLVGMEAISDLGDLYEYVPVPTLDGRLRRAFKRLRKRVRRRFVKIGRGIKRAIKKTRFGRAIIRLGKKIVSVSKRIIKKIAPIVGKWCTRLAPLAAMIPGFGPAISGVMLAVGTAATLIHKYGGKVVDIIGTIKKGDTKGLAMGAIKGITPANKKRLARDLVAEAKKISKMPKSVVDSINKKLRKIDPKKVSFSRVRVLSKAQLAQLAKIGRGRGRAAGRAGAIASLRRKYRSAARKARMPVDKYIARIKAQASSKTVTQALDKIAAARRKATSKARSRGRARARARSMAMARSRARLATTRRTSRRRVIARPRRRPVSKTLSTAQIKKLVAQQVQLAFKHAAYMRSKPATARTRRRPALRRVA